MPMKRIMHFECPAPEAHPDYHWYLDVYGVMLSDGLQADLTEHAAKYHGGQTMVFRPSRATA